jgi:uncharacterized YccA/Bax inhibitor family protein
MGKNEGVLKASSVDVYRGAYVASIIGGVISVCIASFRSKGKSIYIVSSMVICRGVYATVV